MEVVGNFAGCWEKDERTCGDGLRGIPDVGLEESVVDATELLAAEVVVIDKALKRFFAILYRAHFDTAAHAVEGHLNHRVAGHPADGAVLGIVGYLPDARLGLDKGLVPVRIILGLEVIDGRVLIEVVGGVGFTLGGRTVSDVIVDVGDHANHFYEVD